MNTRSVCLALLAIDAALLSLYVIWQISAGGGVPYMVHIETRLGLPSLWIYAKWALIFGLLYGAALRSGSRSYMYLSSFAAVLFLNDFFEVHETVGAGFANRMGFGDVLGLPPAAFGEIVFIAAIFAFFVFSLTKAWSHARTASNRRDIVWFAALVGLLAFFGVVVDAVHAALVNTGATKMIDRGVGLIEDGGELIVASLIVAHAWAMWTVAAGKSERPASKRFGFPKDELRTR